MEVQKDSRMQCLCKHDAIIEISIAVYARETREAIDRNDPDRKRETLGRPILVGLKQVTKNTVLDFDRG